MSQFTWILLSCLMTLFSFAGEIEGVSSTRQSSFLLLREGIGARAVAMGEAYTAVSGDQTAAFWNPAGIAALKGKDFLLVHHHSFQGIQQTYGGWAFGNGRRGLGFSLGVYSAGGLETRIGPSAEPLGTFSLYEIVSGLSFSGKFGKRFYAGWSIHVLHETIGPDSASGISLDFGFLYRSAFEGLTLGVAYRNLGGTGQLDRESIPLPRILRFGSVLLLGSITGSADFGFISKNWSGFHLGLEYSMEQTLFLRTGYKSGHETRDFSFGIGLQRRNLRIDYAYVPTALDLGGSHRIALGIR